MVLSENTPTPARDWDAVPSVVRARSLLAGGKCRAALMEAWRAASVAVDADDERGYEVVGELAREIGEKATGRSSRSAATLVRYVENCQDPATAGSSGGSLLSRLFGVRAAPRTKVCPECAEHVREAAKVCRFCNHRFDDA